MIPPSYRRRNVPTSNLNPGRVNCQTREAAPRARCMKFFSKIYEIPRVAAALVLCASFVPVKFTVLNLVLYAWLSVDVACEAWCARDSSSSSVFLRKFTQCLCYAREIKTYTLQGTAVVCFSQRWVNTNFGIIYNTLLVCTRLWLRYCACEKILQKYRSPKRRFYK